MNPVCTPPTPALAPPSYASVEEVRAALHALGSLDLKKLYVIAQVYCRAYGVPVCHMEPRDLLHEAMACTLDGRKQWRHGVSLPYHLERAMENIVWRVRAKLRRRVEAGLGHPENEEETDDPLDRLRDLRSYQRDANAKAAVQEHAEDALEGALALFDDDTEAQAVLRCRASGQKKEEIQRWLNLSDTTYATISKRLLRKITPFYEKLRSADR